LSSGKPPAYPAASVEKLPAPIHLEDLALVQRILGGDSASWETFVDRYSGLILAMARRYLRSRDPDGVRTVFANVLESCALGVAPASFRTASA
jgi:hypothetical protein